MATTKATRAYPSLPDVTGDPASHTLLLAAIRAAVETHERRTRNYLDSFVRLRELEELGLIKIRGDQILLGDSVGVSDGGGAGVSDHGLLTGLGDDDHTQYVLRNILTTDGDLFYRSGGVISRLPVGTESQLLKIVSGVPSWATVSINDPWFVSGYDEVPSSPNSADDEFNDNSFDTTKWTWINQGAASVTEDSTMFSHMLLNTPANAGDNYRMIYQAPSGSTWRYRAKVIGRMSSANFAHAGIFVRYSGNGRFYALGPLYNSGAGMYIQAMSSVTTYSSTPYSLGSLTFDAYWYLDIEYNGTNLIFRYARATPNWSPFSFGIPSFTTALTVAPGTFLTAVPDQIGICGDSNNSQPVSTYVDWFRKIA